MGQLTLTSHKTHKMVKLAKIEGQPKRPMSAYFLWMNEEGREAAKKALPGAGVAEISKHCGEAWKNIDEGDKKKYDVEMPLCLENGGKELLDAAKKAKKEKKRRRLEKPQRRQHQRRRRQKPQMRKSLRMNIAIKR